MFEFGIKYVIKFNLSNILVNIQIFIKQEIEGNFCLFGTLKSSNGLVEPKEMIL
jgi:hypothetical protein